MEEDVLCHGGMRVRVSTHKHQKKSELRVRITLWCYGRLTLPRLDNTIVPLELLLRILGALTIYRSIIWAALTIPYISLE